MHIIHLLTYNIILRFSNIVKYFLKIILNIFIKFYKNKRLYIHLRVKKVYITLTPINLEFTYNVLLENYPRMRYNKYHDYTSVLSPRNDSVGCWCNLQSFLFTIIHTKIAYHLTTIR